MTISLESYVLDLLLKKGVVPTYLSLAVYHNEADTGTFGLLMAVSTSGLFCE